MHPDRDQEKQLEYLSRRTGVGRAEWKSFAANVPVTKKLICKGFKRYWRQSFGPNVRYLHYRRALFCTDDSVLNELLDEAHMKGNMLAVPTKMHVVRWVEEQSANTMSSNAAMLSTTISERVSCLRKHSTVDEEMVGHRAAPIILVRSPIEID